MDYNFKNEVKLFMIFDILGDTVRSGPQLWHIKRKRLEDVKNHILDLLLIIRIIKKYFPETVNLDDDKLFDYVIVHDLPEAITGDITKFEGVSDEEIKRVTDIAIEYLASKFGSIMDIKGLLNNFDEGKDIEAKIVHMIDKVHSSTTFMKYESEEHVNLNNPDIIPELKPYALKGTLENKDLADIFYEYHIRSVNITDDECTKYGISREDANKITNVIKAFAGEMYKQKNEGTLLDSKDDFPEEATIHNRYK